MKITVLDGFALNPGDLSYDSLKEFGEVKVYPRTNAEDVVSRIADSEAILLNKICITEEILCQCPKLRYIGVQATGFNVIDLVACKKHSVTVTNVPSYSTSAVAQLTFAFITEFASRVSVHNESVFLGDWISSPDFCYWKTPLCELEGKTLGIFGFGNIGQRVERIASAFGMNCIVTTRTPNPQIKNPVDFETLLKESDFLTLHAPLTPETQGIISSKTICKMKPSSFLINTARGALVQEEELSYELLQGTIQGYAADVISEEPMNPKNPLLKVPKGKIILTPHIAWAAVETRKRLLEIVVENLRCFLNGNPQNVVS